MFDLAFASRVDPFSRLSSPTVDRRGKSNDVDLRRDYGVCFCRGDLEQAIRFFYILWFRVGLLKDADDLVQVYKYYLIVLNSRSEVRKYVDEYYPGLFRNLGEAPGGTPRNS